MRSLTAILLTTLLLAGCSRSEPLPEGPSNRNVSATGTVKNAQYLFIQVWTRDDQVVEIGDTESPGHANVYINKRFIACIQAKALNGWNISQVVPFSIGFIIPYEKDAVLEVFKDGAVTRMNVDYRMVAQTAEDVGR